MRSIVRVFVLAAVSTCATAACALDRAEVKVPFNFETHGKIFPAGTYEVEFDQMQYALKLSSKTDSKLLFIWIAAHADVGPNVPTLSLKFDHRTDGTRALRSIRLETWITPVLDTRDKHLAQHEMSSKSGR